MAFFYFQKDKSQIEGQVVKMEETEARQEEPPLVPNPEEPANIISQAKEFVVTAKKFEFIPGTINVNQGDKVKLIVTSTDAAHGIFISDYKINERLNSGETKIIEFTADKKGEFPIICNVPCGSGHRSMRGSLVVN